MNVAAARVVQTDRPRVGDPCLMACALIPYWITLQVALILFQ